MKYRRKPQHIEAFQYEGDFMDQNGEYYVPDWAQDAVKTGEFKFINDGKLYIQSESHDFLAYCKVGDYIVLYDDGSIIPYDKETFLNTFELVGGTNA